MSDTLLPPGQSLTRKFPVVGERQPSPEALDLDRWRLTIDGLVNRPLALDWSEFAALPHAEREVDIHCVTGWSRLGTRLGGVPFDAICALVAPLSEARFARFEAFSERAHDTSLPLELARRDTWLVDTVDGRALEVEHGFPLRTVTPSRYFYKSLKWVRHIELLADDRLGYWERESAYHNVGDPWPGDQRFTTGSLDPDELARLQRGERLAPWRLPRKVVLAADLRGWRPADRDLSRLQLKSCDLRGAHLSGCSLREANLSLSDLRGADLSSADLTGADLEGVNFAGTDLSGACLAGCALSAARFYAGEGADRVAATVVGLRLEGAEGLLEDQERFLRERGVTL